MVKKTPKTEEIRDKTVHIAFSESEKNKIRDYAKEGNTTISEFIRQAIYDKMRVIENPEKYQDITSSEQQLKEIQETQKKQMELQNLILERMNVVNGINETFEALKPLISKEKVKEICDTIISMLKVHKTLKIEKLMLLTGFDKKVVYDCIAVNEKLVINESEEVYIQ